MPKSYLASQSLGKVGAGFQTKAMFESQDLQSMQREARRNEFLISISSTRAVAHADPVGGPKPWKNVHMVLQNPTKTWRI
jgi:hypothetical protein